MSQEKRRVLSDRIREWSGKPELNVHKIIALVAQSEAGVLRDELVQRVADVTQSKNPYGAVASLLTDSGNAYGRVFEEADGVVRLHPAVAQEVRSFRWRAR
jgi:predicted secreted hydrolase